MNEAKKVRGSRFFIEFTERDKTNTVTKGADRKRRGRSVEMMEQRNRKLAYRYYYYTKFLKYGYDQTLAVLRHEFDLTECTLGQWIEDNRDLLVAVRSENPSIGKMKQKYPYLRWDIKPIQTIVG